MGSWEISIAILIQKYISSLASLNFCEEHMAVTAIAVFHVHWMVARPLTQRTRYALG